MLFVGSGKGIQGLGVGKVMEQGGPQAVGISEHKTSRANSREICRESVAAVWATDSSSVAKGLSLEQVSVNCSCPHYMTGFFSFLAISVYLSFFCLWSKT